MKNVFLHDFTNSQYISDKVDLKSLHKQYYNKNLDYLTYDDLYFNLFDRNKDEQSLILLFEHYTFNRDNLNNLFRILLNKHENSDELLSLNILLEKSITLICEKKPELFYYLKNTTPSFFNSFFYKIAPKNYLTLNIFGLTDEETLVKTISRIENSQTPLLDLIELYDNIPAEKINKIFSPTDKFNLLVYFLHENNQDVVSFLISKHPELISSENKENINFNLIKYFKQESGIEWAKRYLTIEEIDKLLENNIYNNSEQRKKTLTLWKCENFLYNDNSERVEKKKLKI